MTTPHDGRKPGSTPDVGANPPLARGVAVSGRGIPEGSTPRRAYVSFSLEARSMLAVWLDDAPSCSKDQRDPDGWTTGAADTDFLAERLCELAHAPKVRLVRLHGAAAEWWSKIESNRKRALSKKRNEAAAAAVLKFDIPADVEELGKRAGLERVYAKGRSR